MRTHEAFLHCFLAFKVLRSQTIPFVYLIHDEEPIQIPAKCVLGFVALGL